MEKKSFSFEEGSISFEEDRIKIKDKSKRQNGMLMITAIIWILYAIVSLIRYSFKEDSFYLWSGIVIGLANMVVLIMYLFRSSKDTVLKSEIESLEINQKFGNHFLDIKLKGGKLRRVSKIETISRELKDYMEKEWKTNK